VALKNGFDGKYSALAEVFNGPTSMIYGTSSEEVLKDINTLLKKQNDDMFILGGASSLSLAWLLSTSCLPHACLSPYNAHDYHHPRHGGRVGGGPCFSRLPQGHHGNIHNIYL
jgi:hypothetical protein